MYNNCYFSTDTNRHCRHGVVNPMNTCSDECFCGACNLPKTRVRFKWFIIFLSAALYSFQTGCCVCCCMLTRFSDKRRATVNWAQCNVPTDDLPWWRYKCFNRWRRLSQMTEVSDLLWCVVNNLSILVYWFEFMSNLEAFFILFHHKYQN